MEYLLGIDIGGTKCAVTTGKHHNEELNIADKLVFPALVEKGVKYRSVLLQLRYTLSRNTIFQYIIYCVQ